MTATRVFAVLAGLTFIASCVAYHRGNSKWGDQLLCIAYGLVFAGFAAMLRRWGVL